MKVSRKRLVVLALILLLAAGWAIFAHPVVFSPDPSPTATPWPIPRRIEGPGYGVNLHIWWDPWAAVRREWHLVADGGFTWVKQRLAWQDVEGAGPGVYEWAAADRIVAEAEQAEVSLIFRVDHPPAWAAPGPDDEANGTTPPVDVAAFGDFCSTLAGRFRGRVAGYQVWNEPNLAREWGGQTPDPVGYTQLLRACYVGIKRADPEALVISAGLSPTGSGPPHALPDEDFLHEMYEAGAAPYFDLLGLNAPGYKAPPEITPQEAADPANDYGGHRVFCFRHAENMRAIMVEHGDAHKQVAILEFGWHTASSPEHPDYAWFAVTPEQQADYLVRAFDYAREHWSPWIGPMFVWNLPDSHWTPADEEFWWAIADPFWWGFGGDFESWEGADVRLAFEALREMEK